MVVISVSRRPCRTAQRIAKLSLMMLAGGVTMMAEDHKHFQSKALVVSRSVYDNNANNVTAGTLLPPGCAETPNVCASGSKAHPYTSAPNDGLYPGVFNNNLYDGSFGITSKIFLDQINPGTGALINTLAVPSAPSGDHMVTSFSSKSELAVNRSLDGKYLTFMGYVAPVGALDVSNSNTPGVVDPTNPVRESYYRAVAQVDSQGKFHFTLTNAYSGNNGRAAILNDQNGSAYIYAAGNAGNGGTPQPSHVISGTGAQTMNSSSLPETAQTPGLPTPLGSFNITQLGNTADKIGKDTNFRGLTIFHNVIYFTKGSGGNGINTVYFVDTTGSACPNGVGLPAPFAVLPTTGIPYVEGDLQTFSVRPYNMCILRGFPTLLASSTTGVSFPFGIWFGNENTLYVADEGNGDNTYSPASGTYTNAAAQTTAGLQKWVFSSITNSWNYVYTLQTGLKLGVPYTVKGYAMGNNTATGLPWAPATDGLRNITGQMEKDGRVTIWGITSTVSGSGDQGADPNRLVRITDILDNTSAATAAAESFSKVRSARFAEVLRGVSPAPQAESDSGDESARQY